MQALVAQMGLPGKPPRIEMIERSPHAAIRDAVGTFGAELLAMATHARSRRRTLMVGSLAQEFLAKGPCDVLVARG